MKALLWMWSCHNEDIFASAHQTSRLHLGMRMVSRSTVHSLVDRKSAQWQEVMRVISRILVGGNYEVKHYHLKKNKIKTTG